MCLVWPSEAWWNTPEWFAAQGCTNSMVDVNCHHGKVSASILFFHGEHFVGNEPQEITATDYNENTETS